MAHMDWMNSSTKTLTLLSTAALCFTLSACTNKADTISMSEAFPGWDFSQSTPVPKDDHMSGDFNVDADGKLINPDADKTYEAPTPPELAAAPDKNGARAFAQYFVEVVEYTWRTGNTELLRSISHPDCKWCSYIADQTDIRTRAGGWTRGIRVAITHTEDATPIPEHPGYWNVFMDISQDPHIHYNGKQVFEEPLMKTRFQVQLTHDGDSWKVFAADKADQQ